MKLNNTENNKKIEQYRKKNAITKKEELKNINFNVEDRKGFVTIFSTISEKEEKMLRKVTEKIV